MSVSITVQGQDGLISALNALNDSLDTTGILDEAGALLLSRIQLRFRAQTGPDNQAWAPLKPSTIKDRLRKGFGEGPILYRTGTLFNSIQLFADGPNSRAIGSNLVYAAALQFGDGNMPGRPFLGANSEDGALMYQLVLLRIQKALGV
jgi:phage gpG-like protein